MTLIVAIIFLYGLFIGSFLNVCIYRIPEEKSVVSPPSSCGSCGHRLNFLDMIPVLNYFLYRGKCRYCGASFSIQYPLIELFNGIMYVLIFSNYGLSLYFVLYAGIASLLIVISIIDLNTKTIPDGLNLISGIFAVLMGIYLFRGNYLYHFYGFLFGFLLFLLIAVVTNAMGGGDIKLMGVLGILFGLEGIIFTTVLSFIYGALISIGLILSGKASRKDFIPFGPFISLAALTYILVGNIILELYFNLIF
jgi:leader peptidase (prepilin peptidase)/N-methyltransferase